MNCLIEGLVTGVRLTQSSRFLLFFLIDGQSGARKHVGKSYGLTFYACTHIHKDSRQLTSAAAAGSGRVTVLCRHRTLTMKRSENEVLLYIRCIFIGRIGGGGMGKAKACTKTVTHLLCCIHKYTANMLMPGGNYRISSLNLLIEPTKR